MGVGVGINFRSFRTTFNRCFPHWFCGFLAGAHDSKEKNGFGFGFAECDRGSWVK